MPKGLLMKYGLFIALERNEFPQKTSFRFVPFQAFLRWNSFRSSSSKIGTRSGTSRSVVSLLTTLRITVSFSIRSKYFAVFQLGISAWNFDMKFRDRISAWNFMPKVLACFLPCQNFRHEILFWRANT